MGSQPASIHQHWSWLSVIYRVADAACILIGLMTAGILTETIAHERFVLAATAAVGLYFIMAEITGVYRQTHGKVTERDVVRTVVTWAATLAALLAIGFVSRYATDASRKTLLAWLATTPVLITSARIVICWFHQSLVARGVGVRRCAIVGVNKLAFQLVENVQQSPEHGLKIVGFFDDRPAERTPGIPQGLGDRVGDITALVRQARKGEIDNIYITFPMRAEQRIRNVLEKLADSTASVYVVPDFFVFELLHSRWANFGGLPAVSVFENPLYGADGLVKRIVDFSLATAALVVLALPMLVLAVLIKATSPGPVFFRQKRYGLDGREILVWKFRSMTVCENGDTVKQATKNDARVTPLGAFMRKTSLDELPQLFNVLLGNMSLVGPRPHANSHNELFRKRIPGYMLRHKVRPGITGLAQVNGWRGETDTIDKMEGRIQCDHRYIREWSLWLDIKILFKTFFVVFSRKNAY